MNVWQFQRKLSTRLARWSWLSLFLGWAMRKDTYKPIQAVGNQFILWGLIDLLIAKWANRTSTKKQTDAHNLTPAVQEKTRKRLRKILWFNAGMDVGYMLLGRSFMNRNNETDKGKGIGILIQGAFLFFFDIYHAWKINRE